MPSGLLCWTVIPVVRPFKTYGRKRDLLKLLADTRQGIAAWFHWLCSTLDLCYIYRQIGHWWKFVQWYVGTHQSYSQSQIALVLQASVFVISVFGDISLICWISQHFLAVVSAHFNNKIYWHCSLWKWAACHGSCLWHMTLEFTQPSQISCFDLYITVSIANLLLSVVKKCLYAVWTNCVLYLCQWNHCQASGVESCIFYRWFWISAVRWVQVGTF